MNCTYNVTLWRVRIRQYSSALNISHAINAKRHFYLQVSSYRKQYVLSIVTLRVKYKIRPTNAVHFNNGTLIL
jgi:hypothetical protein